MIKVLLMMLVSLACACSAVVGDGVGWVEQGATVHDPEGSACPPGPTGGGQPSTYIVSPTFDDVGMCGSGAVYPMRCAQCSFLSSDRACVPACNSTAAKCTFRRSDSTCQSPSNGSTSHNCDSVPQA